VKISIRARSGNKEVQINGMVAGDVSLSLSHTHTHTHMTLGLLLKASKMKLGE
jgi:hypothetical protein